MPIYSQPTAKSVTTLTKEPSGWADRTTATISRVNGTLTFSVAPVSGSFTIYIKGIPYTYTSTQNVTWTDTEGTWFFYFDTSGVLTSTQDANVWTTALLGDGVLVASLYWDATNNVSFIFSEERHGFMEPNTHLEFHNAFGTQWVSGGLISPTTVSGTGGNASDAQLGVSTVTIYDEDIRLTWSNGSPQTMNNPAAIPVYYKSGASGYWRKKTADSWPFIYSGTAGYTGANGRIPYNQNNAGTWSLTQIAQSNYVLIHLYATNDIVEPIIAIQGQTEYTSLALAQSGATTELLSISTTVKGLSIEITPLGSLVLQSNSGYTNTPKARFQPATAAGASYIDFRGNTFRSGMGSGVTIHSQLTGLTAPADDHTQYPLSAGRAGGQTLIGGTAASENLTLQSTANATRGNILSLDSLFLSTNGSTISPDAPRTIGFDNLSSGEAGRIQFGDTNNAWQNGYDQLMQMYAYWQIQIYGRRTGTAVPWTSYGSAPSTASLQVINTDVNAVAIEIKGASSQAANLQNWVNSSGTALARVDASGNISFNSTQTVDGVDVSAIYAASSPLQTYSLALSDAQVNVYGTTSTFYGIVIPAYTVSIKTIQAYVYQSASGNIQCGLYNAATGARIATTDSVSSSTTGIKTMTFATAQSLTKGTAYYLAISCTANGSTFAGKTVGTWNTTPRPSAYENNNRLPATLTSNSSTSLVWMAAFTA
jgi:hypothetical protein